MKNFKGFIIRVTHSRTYYNIANVTSKICFLFLLICLFILLFEEHFSKIIAPFAVLAIIIMFFIDFLNVFRLQSKETIIKNSLLIIFLANKNSWFWMFYMTAFGIYCLFPQNFNYVISSIVFIGLIIFSDKISKFFYQKLIH